MPGVTGAADAYGRGRAGTGTGAGKSLAGLRYSALTASYAASRFSVVVNWAFMLWGLGMACTLWVRVIAELPALAGLRAKSALGLGDYGLPHARNIRDWSALRHAA